MSVNYIEEPAVKALDLGKKGLEALMRLADDKHQKYIANQPFPHIVIDGLFPDELLNDVLEEIRDIQHPIEKKFYGAEGKYATPDPWLLGPVTKRFLMDLNSAPFCRFLEDLTGIADIIPDPHFEGGGIHEIKKGGFLKMHTDFNWHQTLKLDRRINMLIYLNKDWEDSWGGQLELWDQEMKQRKVRVSPAFNKTVIFSTSDFSYHGHPEPVECPEDMSRKSLALYYYSNGRPEEEARFGKSISTNYKLRPDDSLHTKISFHTRKVSLKILPPVFISLYNFIRRRI